MKLLIIEDETDLLTEIQQFFSGGGYVCEMAECFQKASEKIELYNYDLIIVDITLPDGNGIDIIKQIRKKNASAGVLVLSARDSLDDKLAGLTLGADDYLTKPFHFAELNARVKSILRRRKQEGAEVIIFNEIEICPDSSTASVNGVQLILTRKEYELLFFFVVNKNRLLTKEAIAEHLWGDNIDMADNFDFIYTHINNLRRKIELVEGVNYVKNLYGMGYKFTDQ